MGTRGATEAYSRWVLTGCSRGTQLTSADSRLRDAPNGLWPRCAIHPGTAELAGVVALVPIVRLDGGASADTSRKSNRFLPLRSERDES